MPGKSSSELMNSVFTAVFTFIFIIFVLTVIVIGCVIMYKLLRAYALRNIEYKRYFSEKGAFEGQEIYLVEEFSNRGILPLFKMDVETHITSKLEIPGCITKNEYNQEFISRFFVMPFTRVKRKHKIICTQRGVYMLESAKLYFMKVETFIDSKAILKVYPKELEIQDVHRVSQCLELNNISRRPLNRDPFSFAKVRDYGYGDCMNMINHKASARAGKLMVNETEFILGRNIMVYLNFQDGDNGIPIKEFEKILEKGCSYVSYIAGKALREGYRIGIRLNAKTWAGEKYCRVSAGTGMQKYMEILDALANARTSFGNSIGYVMNQDINDMITKTEIIVFSTYTDSSMEQKILEFEKLGNVVTIIDLKEVTAYEK